MPSDSKPPTYTVSVVVKIQSSPALPEMYTMPGALMFSAANVIGESALTTVASLQGEESGTIPYPDESVPGVVNVTLNWTITATPDETDSPDQDEPSGDE